MNAYGMTEIGVVMGGLNVSHLGTLYPGASIKVMRKANGERTGADNNRRHFQIADPVSGRTLGPNEEGEIRAKSHGVLLRFVGDPTAKANLLDDDGFFHTGDLGYYTADAKIIFKERLKEIIKYLCCCDKFRRPLHFSTALHVCLSIPGTRETTYRQPSWRISFSDTQPWWRVSSSGNLSPPVRS